MGRKSKKFINLRTLDFILSWLLVVGGINWGLQLFDFNLVTWLAQNTFSQLQNILYGVIGFSGLWVGSRAVMGKLMK